MKTYKQLRKILKEIKLTEDGVGAGSIGGGITNAVSANGPTIAGAPPDSPPVNMKKRKKVMGYFKRNPPQM